MPGRPGEYSSLLHCFKSTYRRGGLRALYSGILPNMLKAVPSISISYVIFEKVKHFLSNLEVLPCSDRGAPSSTTQLKGSSHEPH